MSSIAALGEPLRVEGFALAGVSVLGAATVAEVEARWAAIGSEVRLLLVTAAAAEALAERFQERPDLLVTVLP